jgi:galactokinase
MAMASDLPAAAGMSSSSALVVTIFLILADVNDIWSCRQFGEHVRTRQQLAEYLGTVENGQSFRGLAGDRGVGTFGGSEDHTAILCAQPGRLAQYSYCPVRFERSVPLPPDLTFALGASGVVAEKTGAALEKYNRVSTLAMQLSKLWQAEVGGEFLPLADMLADPAGNRYERMCQTVQRAALPVQLRESLLKRLRHFYEESCQIIPAVPDNLASRDSRLQFAALVDRSQDQGAELLGNQVPETVFLAQAARGWGALTASGFGAGFGGSVWAMVEKSTAEAFCRQWRNVYHQRFPEAAGRSDFLVSGAGPAAFRLGQDTHLFGAAER